MLDMHCPFCQQKMQSIDSGSPPPRLSMIWKCKRCPREVVILSEKDVEEEQHWLTKSISIFVNHNNKNYCLKWDFYRKNFSILDVAADNNSGYIMQMQEMPTSITPQNALDRLKTLLMFQ